MRYAILLMFSLSVFAQSKPDDAVVFPQATTIAVAAWPEYVSWSDRVAANGHYVATIDDPNNEFRCDVTSYVEKDPRNALGSEVTSFTVVCTKKREPQHDTK